MLTFLFMMMCLDGNTEGAAKLHISGTEIFQRMLPEEVFVAGNGEVYILHFEEARIQHYDKDGKFKQYIGGKGKGPGEFGIAAYINMAANHLYVYDELNSQISEFALDGKFQRRIDAGQRGLKLGRTNGGWFFMPGNRFNEKEGSTEIKWTQGDFEKAEVILPIDKQGWGAGTWVMSSNGETRITYSPLEARPRLIVSPDGKRFYLADTFKFEIHVYDGNTGKLLHTIKRTDKPIPFDTDWADEKLAERSERLKRRNPGVPIEKLYPEYFPAIRDLAFDVKGNLVVDRWMGRPDDNHHTVSYDSAGNETDNLHQWNVLRRLAGVANGYAYLVMFDGEEAGIAKVPVAEINDFEKAHPIEDWSFSRSIDIDF